MLPENPPPALLSGEQWERTGEARGRNREPEGRKLPTRGPPKECAKQHMKLQGGRAVERRRGVTAVKRRGERSEV